MTRTISFKQTLKQSLAVARHDLKKCRLPLIIYAVIAAFFTTAILALSLVNRRSPLSSVMLRQTSDMQDFYTVAALAVFLLTSIFALIYCFKLFSYLHNKRKQDRIMPMPVRSGVIYLSKALTSFLLAVLPALFFIGIIAVISAIFGVTVNSEVLSMLWKIPLGASACVSFYALLAVCCGTSANTALSYLAICFSYPMAAFYVKNMIDSFFFGIPTNVRGEHFLMKALNPFAAYDGNNVIYWLIFTAACLALGVLLLSRRKAERAQTGFAFRLPCYVVETLVTFIAGMFMGVVFASNKVTGDAFWGFVFGFLLSSATAFTVAHSILFRGFKKLLTSLIGFGAAVGIGIALTAVCCFAADSYAHYLPERSEIESAGYIEFNSVMLSDPHFSDISGTVYDSAEDFTDKEDVGSIYEGYESIIRAAEKRTASTKFGSITANAFTDALYSLFNQNKERYSLAFKLSDGSVVTRFYDLNYLEYSDTVNTLESGDLNDYSFYMFSYRDSLPNNLIYTPAYIEKYNPWLYTDADEIESIYVDAAGSDFRIESGKNSADLEKVFNAFCEDMKEQGYQPISSYGEDVRLIIYKKQENTTGSTTAKALLSDLYPGDMDYGDYFEIPKEYTHTIDALKEIGVLKEYGKGNLSSPYYNSHTDYPDYFDGSVDDVTEPDQSYKKGESVYVAGGNLELPFDCVERHDGTFATYYNSNDELLMFESYAEPGEMDGNAFAIVFEIISMEKENEAPASVFYGTAKVRADGEETTLRYLRFGEDEVPEYFVTDKVTPEEFDKLKDGYEPIY